MAPRPKESPRIRFLRRVSNAADREIAAERRYNQAFTRALQEERSEGYHDKLFWDMRVAPRVDAMRYILKEAVNRTLREFRVKAQKAELKQLYGHCDGVVERYSEKNFRPRAIETIVEDRIVMDPKELYYGGILPKSMDEKSKRSKEYFKRKLALNLSDALAAYFVYLRRRRI